MQERSPRLLATSVLLAVGMSLGAVACGASSHRTVSPSNTTPTEDTAGWIGLDIDADPKVIVAACTAAYQRLGYEVRTTRADGVAFGEEVFDGVYVSGDSAFFADVPERVLSGDPSVIAEPNSICAVHYAGAECVELPYVAVTADGRSAVVEFALPSAPDGTPAITQPLDCSESQPADS